MLGWHLWKCIQKFKSKWYRPQDFLWIGFTADIGKWEGVKEWAYPSSVTLKKDNQNEKLIWAQ